MGYGGKVFRLKDTKGIAYLVEVRLPLSMDEVYQVRDRVHELVIQLQEQYDVLILASAVPA